jgi:ATP-dependent exoDNAse (exonuclease V) beta subunit
MKPKLDDNIGKVYSLEQALYSDELKLAGRVDCIAEWNGQLSVVDFKSAAKEKKEDWIENYFMQCTAYAIMFEERTGIPINQIVVAIAVTNGDSQIFVKQKDEYMSGLRHFIDEYYSTL